VRFFLDHDVPAEVARVLRQEGHEALELRRVLSVQATDPEVFDYARENQLLLITCNRDDFLPLASGSSNPGIIILIRRRSRHAECANLLALLARSGEPGLRHKINFARATPSSSRIFPVTHNSLFSFADRPRNASPSCWTVYLSPVNLKLSLVAGNLISTGEPRR
jgi:predicted nuclease of predicted toxin-antitoxin system